MVGFVMIKNHSNIVWRSGTRTKPPKQDYASVIKFITLYKLRFYTCYFMFSFIKHRKYYMI